MAEALSRVSQQLKPQVRTGTLETSVYGQNTNAAPATVQTDADIAQANQYYQGLYGKSAGDYAQDAAVALGKGIVSVPQAVAGLADIIDSGIQGVGVDGEIQGGRVSKNLADIGVDFQTTQDIMGGWYSEATQRQQQELAALPGMSTQKSLGENLDSLGQTAGYVMDNPSLALNTIIESLPSLAAGGVVGRGAAALGARGASSAIGEGTVMAGQAQANMDRNAEGYTTGQQALGALGIGILGGGVGAIGSRLANRAGAVDIDQAAAGISSRVANKGFKSLAAGTLTEGAEEAAQSSIENVIANISSGKDAIEGLNQDLVLGTLAGAGMGAAANSKSSMAAAAMDALTTVAQKQSERMKERLTREAPERTDISTEELANPSSESYNPSAAIVRMGQEITATSTPEQIQEVAANIDGVLETAETKLDQINQGIEAIQGMDVLRQNIAAAEAAVVRFAESNPERAAQIQDMADTMNEQLAQTEAYASQVTVEQLQEALPQAQKLVADAREMHTKFAPVLGRTANTDAPIDAQIFGAPSKFTAEQIDKAIADPNVPESSKAALRAMSAAVVAQNAVKSIDDVNQQVVGKRFDPNYRSTPQYMDQFAKAIGTNAITTQANLMREISAFEQSHTQKAELTAIGLDLAKQGQRNQIVRNQDGNWEFNQGEFLKGDAARENGAITIHATPRGIAAMEKTNEYMQAEAQAITATRTAMEAMQQVQTPKPTQQAPQQAPIASDPMQDAMDSYNQDLRDNYDFQPDRRSIDPRDNETRSSTTETKPTAADAQAEVQSAKGATSTKPVSQPPSTQEYDLVFDENGVGSNVPKARNKVTLTTKNKYGEKDQAKADLATKFIGQGSETSSTNQYAQDFGDKANTGTYTANDIVFVSAEGARNNRKKPNYAELDKAIKAGATFITDNQADRERSYNVGEREVAKYLTDNGYVETKSGTWTPQPLAQTERVTSRSVSEDAVTEVQASTDKAIEATPDVSTDAETNEVVVQETKPEPEPQDVNTAESPDAVTTVLRKEERAKAPNKRNLVLDGFNRKDTVLNLNPDFMSNFMTQSDNSEMITEVTGLKLNSKQKQAVKDFTKFAKYMSPRLDGLVKERKGVTAKGNDYSDFRYQDFNQFLLEDGQLPENVKTAISAAMFNWIAENGSKTLNSEKDVSGLLFLNNVETLPSNVFTKLTAIGEHQAVITSSLGQKALQALGLKVVSDVDPARKAKLEMALGTLASVALVQNGYMERNVMPRADFKALQDQVTGVNEDAEVGSSSASGTEGVVNFLRPIEGIKVNQVIESAKETSSIVGKIFDVQSDNKMPSTEPVTTTPNTINHMGTQTPDYAKEVYEASQKNGFKMSAPAMQFIDKVSRDELKELFGYIKPNADDSFDGMHKKFWKGQHAANQALERSIDLIGEQRANLADDAKEFFFEHTIWTNTRSGYDAAFNLQANKVHRAVAGMSAHVTEVGVGEPSIVNGETTKYGEFLQAIAMSAEGVSDVLGIQTVDKMSAESFLPLFEEFLTTDVAVKGIESMASILETNSTKEDLANVKALVDVFDMGPMSVRAIQALAQHHIAERDGAKTFTSDIAFESDGVTNGPVITNVALNTADADMLEAGGVFTDKAKTNVPTNKEQGSQDIYEQLGSVMKRKWSDAKNDPATKPRALASMLGLDTIYKAFGERKGAKPITTTSNYGAGNASIIRANGREVLNAFYKGLEKAGKNQDMDAAQNLIDAVNQVFTYHNSFLGNVPLAVAQGDPLQFELTQAQEKALLDVSAIQHGKAIKATLEEAMADFQKVRDTLTAQAVTGFKIYDLVRKAALAEALKNTDDVILDSKGNRQEGLTSKQEKAALKTIAKYTPSVVSGMGNNSANGKQSSIPLMKLDTAWDESKMSEQQFNFNGSWDSKQGKGFSVKATIKRDAVADPGVSGLALIIQSLDAFIAHTTIKNIPSQNYHDANATKVGDGKKMAKIQNEAFVDGLMTTHVNREFVRALMNPMQKLVDDPAFYKANKKAVDEILTDLESLPSLVTEAYERDLAKLNGMKTWENVNQYGTQGGHFVMTDAKRSEIVKAVEKLRKDYKKDMAQANAIYMLVSSKPEPTTIQEHLEQDGTMKGEDLVPMLQAELKQFQSKEGNAGKFSQFYDSMLDLITERMPAGLEINYFSDLEAPANANGVKEAMDSNNPAWFTTGKDGNPQINILKSNEPIKAQVLVHELVHAITVDSIAQVRNEPTAHAMAKESLDKIDALYEFIKAEVKADPNATDLMKYATQNVEEFIATGFSYPEFVDYLDSKLAPKAVRGKNRIVTALRSFVENILGVLESFTGRKYSAKDATALEALILDSTEFLGRTVPPTTGSQSTIFGAPRQARDVVSGYTSKQVFAALDSNLDPEFKKQLTTLMSEVSDTIYEGLDHTILANPDGTWSVETAWEDYIKAGKALTTETATTAGYRMTDQENFAVESLYTALVHGLKDKAMSPVYNEMSKTHKAAAAKLKPQDFYQGDWSTASRDDKRDAQDMYDFLFKYGKDNPEPLARFVSMALGSQQVNSLLGFTTREVDAKPTDTFEKLVEGANTVMNFVSGLMTNSSPNQNINSRLGQLSKELARIDAKNRGFAISKVESQLEKLVDLTDGVSDKIRDQVVKLAEHDKLANSRFTAVRLASNVTRLSAKGDLWTTLDVIKDMGTMDNPNSRLGLLGEIVNEAANNDDTKVSVEKMLRITKLNNHMKESIREATTKNVMSTYEENGKYLDKDTKTAVSAMLRADTQCLIGHYSLNDIARMYNDNSYVNAETIKLEKQLGDQVMINRAKQLAKYMVTGLSSNGLAKNAVLIVSGFNPEKIVDSSDARVGLVDRIATMYAIQYMDSKTKKDLGKVMKRELKNKTNGIDTSLRFHKELSKSAADTLFINNPTSMIKGFVPEITNPNREVRIAHSDAEAKLLQDQFFKEVKSVGRDAKDPRTTTARLFLTEEANIQRLVSGVIEVVSTNRKGTSIYMEPKEKMQAIKAVQAAMPTSPNYNPMHDKDVYMTPNYDTQGKIIGFSYEMSGRNRDVLLERNNDFSELLGAYAATNYNKVKVPDQNNRVVDAAYEDYKENFSKNPRAYVTVGPNSNDYGLREVWALLPESTRDHITQVWGDDGMQVRNDVLLTMFGYRKYSLNQAFDKMADTRNMFENIYVGIMKEVFGNNAKIRGVQGERAWQEAVSLVKDIVVIRNVKTILMNTMSNAMLLSAHGVSPSDIVKDTLLSVRSGLQYRRDMANLLAAQQNLRAGIGNEKKLEQDILKYQDSLSRNPLASFIEEGMMPTIVEDIDPDTNLYSYKSKLQQRLDSVTSNVPKSVKTAAKWAFVSPDTPLYKFLNNATQFSDFSAKYSLYKYYTTKAKEKLSKDEALQIASDNFINYDVPTAKGLQYLNDMGVVMFTKYNLRIQKALFQLLKKRPATAMIQALFINSFTNMEAGIDPLLWFNLGNPVRDGAFGLPSALDEPMPIKMLASVF